MWLENVLEENYCVSLQWVSVDIDIKSCCLVMYVVKNNLALLTELEIDYEL